MSAGPSDVCFGHVAHAMDPRTDECRNCGVSGMALRLAAVRDAKQAARQQQAISQGVPFAEQVELESARKRIAELEAERDRANVTIGDGWTTECRLRDEAGALRTELTQVKAENSDLRREVERLQRKAAKR